jgi:hypothetical protein
MSADLDLPGPDPQGSVSGPGAGRPLQLSELCGQIADPRLELLHVADHDVPELVAVAGMVGEQQLERMGVR